MHTVEVRNAGINSLRIFSVMIADRETKFTAVVLQIISVIRADNSFGDISVGSHAVNITGINSPTFSFGR